MKARKQCASSPNMSASIQTLIEKADKYDKIREILNKHLDDPDDLVMLQEICVKSHADGTLDEIMDVVGVDTLEDLKKALEVFQEFKIERKRPKPSVFETTEAFWDCECNSDYIHRASESKCHKCGCYRDECPDSRVEEVKNMLFEKAVEAEEDYDGSFGR